MNRLFLMCTLAALMCAGCQSMPWNKGKDLPPVELLDESKDAATPAPVAEPAAPAADKGTGEKPLVGGPRRFEDIPLPEKAREDEDHTVVRQSANSRQGNMFYTCRASTTAIAQFYLDECPKSGWTLKEVIQARGKELHFEKGSERLVVEVHSQGVGRSALITIVLN